MTTRYLLLSALIFTSLLAAQTRMIVGGSGGFGSGTLPKMRPAMAAVETARISA